MTQPAARVTSDCDDLFAPVELMVDRRADGSIILRSAVALAAPARCVGDWLEHWARAAPDRIFLAERSGAAAPWSAVSYSDALRRVYAIGSWIASHELSVERPITVLSDNGIEHALLALAAMHVGVPIAAVSPAYSLASKDHATLKNVIALLRPGVIYVANLEQFAPALAAIAPLHQGTVIAGHETKTAPTGAVSFADVESETNHAAVTRALAEVHPDTIARFLFTSGSTGVPKAVINTQRMLTSNQAAKAQTWPFLDREPPVVLDWLPWSHTFGANHNFNMVLRAGGTFYIDRGKPAPHLFQLSVDNLRAVAPTICFNVPRGFDMLVGVLQRDADLRRHFFASVKLVFYAAAALPQNIWEALEDLSMQAIGRRTPMVSSWGSTETAPMATDCHFQAERSGNIGVPVPGVELKLVPSGDKLEVRVRGPNVTPGYWKAPELTAKAFDDEGFYIIGDAVKFVDPSRPERGLLFDGRTSEDFKLTTGSWVSVGTLRTAGIEALAPVAQDIVVAGHDRAEIGFLVFPNMSACRLLAGLQSDATASAVLEHPRIREAARAGLRKLKARGGGTSSYAARALLMEEPASADFGEITDKGYINQRAVLARRATHVARLYDKDEAGWIGCRE